MPPFDGKAFAERIIASVKQHVSEATRPIVAQVAALESKVAALPVAKDGASVTVADVAPMIAAEVGKAVAALPVPQPGRDADVGSLRDELKLFSGEKIRELFDALPKPSDGKSVTADELAPLVAGEVGKAVAALPKAKDGVGVAGAVIDRGGALVLTLTDGSTKDLGVIVGRDADMAELARLIKEEVGRLPKPSDGNDGFGFDDLTVTHDGERGFSFSFKRGNEVKEFPFTLAHVLDRGVWREGKYLKGDGVTFGGSFFIAQKDTETKPETSSDWRLAIKRGRDGKDADPQAMARAIDAALAKIPPSKLKP